MITARRKYLYGFIRVSKHYGTDVVQSGYLVAGIPVLTTTVSEYQGWFRIFGKGLKWKRLDKHPKMFGERNGFSKYIVINNWLISYLP